MLSFINNISIRSKLFVLALLPLIGFIGVATHDFMQAYQQKNILEKMLVLTDSGSVSSSLVHELQKERGASAVIYHQKEKNLSKKLKSIVKQLIKKTKNYKTL